MVAFSKEVINMEEKTSNEFSYKIKKFFTRKVKIAIAIVALVIVILLGILFNFTVY